jgi:hypothetical protein
LRIGAGLKSSYDAFNASIVLRKASQDRSTTLEAGLKDHPETKEASDAVKALNTQLEAILTGSMKAPGIGPINRDLARIDFMIEVGDAAPSESALAAIADSCSGLSKRITAWRELQSQKVPAVNAILEKYKLAPLPVTASASGAAPAAAAAAPGSGHVPIATTSIEGKQETPSDPPADACRP